MYPVSPYSRASYLAGQWVPTSSSWVAAVRWQVTGELDVRTGRGQVLHYGGCDAALFDALLAAPSKGSFVNAAIKSRCVYNGSTP